jgi:hypothetical protein
MTATTAKQKFAHLSVADKLKLLDVIERKKALKRESRDVFVPHVEQRAVALCDKKVRIVTSGNGWGKSAYGCNEAIWAESGVNPIRNINTHVPCRIIVVLDAPSKVADVWLPEIKKWTNLKEDQLWKDGKPFISRITFPNGSEIRFMFHLQEALAFESIEAQLFIFDEPPPRDVWVALMRAGRTKGHVARYLIIATPISQSWLREYHSAWTKGEFPDTEFFAGTTEANRKNLADGYIEDFSRHLTEREKRTRLEGAFFNAEGLALSDLFKRDQHLVPRASLPDGYERDWAYVIAIDPHPEKRTYACLLAVSPEGRKYYVDETAQKVVPRDFGRWLQENWLNRYNIRDMVCDSAGKTDFTGGEGFMSFIEVLNSMGIRVRGTTFDEKGDVDFLTRIQEGLYIAEGGEPKLQFVKEASFGIVHDIQEVAWKPIKGSEVYQPKLEISNRDYLACLKYALATNLTFEGAKRRVIRPAGGRSEWRGPQRKQGTFEARWQRDRKPKDDFDDF